MSLNSQCFPDHFLRKISPVDRKKMGKAGLTREEVIAKLRVEMEKDFHAQVEGLLRIRDVRWWHHSRTDRRTTDQVGTPDFLFCYKGRSCAIECKMRGKQESKEQMEARQAMLYDGWRFLLAYNIDEVIQFLNSIE